jgi:ketosteroid isomerase-like protein
MSSVMEGLRDAMNAHDAQRMASMFAADYESVQPVHPARTFRGRDQVRANWSAVFEGVPDFEALLVASVVDRGTEWGEWDWRGHHVDGSDFAMRGVVILFAPAGPIMAMRLYVEPVEDDRDDIDAAVRELYRPPSVSPDVP